MFRVPDLRALALPGGVSGVVTVWETGLTAGDERARLLHGYLSHSERERADRFRFERDRRCYTVARGTLRELLGERLGLDPAAVRFLAGPHGKPALAHPGSALRFNVSHSGDRALIAVADGGREVGVDLENAVRLGEARDLPALAARTLTPTDLARWQALPEGERAREFLRAWTRLEAFGKATGGGLGQVLGAVSVAGARWPDVAPGWRGWDLSVGAGWGGALVVGSPSG